MSRAVLITGGAGFIGSNAAAHYLGRGDRVTVIDNLSRDGVLANLQWLKSRFEFEFIHTDVRRADDVSSAIGRARWDLIIHLAGQVAVTHSVTDPRTDFEVNALGTLNILEAVRHRCPDSFVIFSSTNKVYGSLPHLQLAERDRRYEFADLADGVDETQLLDFHSPYGCSKGAGDQYVLDYARTYGLRTISLRQSCIYGPRQLGVQDQGWVSWFMSAALLGKPITIYGNGKQMRDILEIEDLIECFEQAYLHRETVSGSAYNIGGGPTNTLSLLELLDWLGQRTGARIEWSYGPPRRGDQLAFVCDTRKAQRDFGWSPKTTAKDGIERLFDFVSSQLARPA